MKAGIDYIGVGCGALILNDKGETLLLKRGPKCRNEVGTWSRPGGAVEFGETVEDAIKREIKEELGVAVEIEKFCGYSDYFVRERCEQWVTFDFIVRIVEGAPKNMEPDKHEEIKWFSLNDLPDKIYSPSARAIKQFLAENF